jgi:hypothetical protein
MTLRRRGPRPKGPFEGQVLTLTTRITPETRAKLDAVAASNGRSLSQEVELRLVRSIEEDKQLASMMEQRRSAMMQARTALQARTEEFGIVGATFGEATQAAVDKLRVAILALEDARQALDEVHLVGDPTRAAEPGDATDAGKREK